MGLLNPVVHLLIRCVRLCSKTHYETLKVERNATNKEIKESFVKLSKEFHPDKRPNDPASHSAFIKLNEAYTTLSKSETRQLYDNRLDNPYSSNPYYQNQPKKNWQNENAYWGFPQRHTNDQTTKRRPNLWIAFACFTFMVLGTIFQFYSIQYGRSILEKKVQAEQVKNKSILKEIMDKKVDIDTRLEILKKNIEKRTKK